MKLGKSLKKLSGLADMHTASAGVPQHSPDTLNLDTEDHMKSWTQATSPPRPVASLALGSWLGFQYQAFPSG